MTYRSSKSVLEHLVVGEKLRLAPQEVRLVFRRWAFATYLPQHTSDRPDLTDAEQAIVSGHNDFRSYVEVEMTQLLADPIRAILFAVAFSGQEKGNRELADSIPWFLRYGTSELTRNKQDSEQREKKHLAALITHKTIYQERQQGDFRPRSPENGRRDQTK